ncbi:hypothetical protein GPECTOR_109g197 [Gonium pectorale]|uniref:Uncharacterized protein n=1 Tax=Gonium pectorale TaxID=33097 RepID=A0A150FZC8_GONPE|nr:hypothetical protein GPECTOR_109g197 [Gonium pectorale]|eukprot:KXZ42954.1 hypothetical protein GPECTOR_109g197 [Gonium pectorale]
MQVSPANLAAWVSLLADLEVQFPAALLAPCPAFLLVPLTDPEECGAESGAVQEYGGPSYGEACARFVRHLRDDLLMDERHVFGLLARQPSLALVQPWQLDEAIMYLSVVIKGAGRGRRLGPQRPSTTAGGGEGGAAKGPTAAGYARLPQRPFASSPSASPLAEEAELDAALYRFLDRAPAVLGIPRSGLSYVLLRMSYDGGLEHGDMCRLVCAVPELLPALARLLLPPEAEGRGDAVPAAALGALLAAAQQLAEAEAAEVAAAVEAEAAPIPGSGTLGGTGRAARCAKVAGAVAALRL